MKSFKINYNEFVKALEKASMSNRDTYVITVSNRECGSGKVLASVAACDGNSQVTATVMVESKTAPFRVCLGSELFTIVKTLSQLQQEIIFEYDENSASLSAGTSRVPVAIKDDGLSIDMVNISKEPAVISIEVNTEIFVEGINSSTYAATSLDSFRELLKDTVCLLPCKEGDSNLLRVVSSNGVVVAGSDVKVEKFNENFERSIKEKSFLSVSAGLLAKVARRLNIGKVTKMYMMPKQLIIVNGNDFYVMRPFEKKYPAAIANMLYQKADSYSLKIKAHDLKVALDIAVLDYCEQNSNKYATITLEDGGKVTVSSIYGKNHTELKAIESNGAISVALKAEYLQRVIDAIGSKEIVIRGEENVKPVYITADDTSSIGLVVPTMPKAAIDENAKATESSNESDKVK